MRQFGPCDICGASLPLGATKYRVQIRIVSAFDGFLPDSDEDGEKRAEEMERLVEGLDSMSAEDLEKQVHQEMDLLLCPKCRRLFVENLLDLKDGEIPAKLKRPHLLH